MVNAEEISDVRSFNDSLDNRPANIDRPIPSIISFRVTLQVEMTGWDIGNLSIDPCGNMKFSPETGMCFLSTIQRSHIY